MKKYNIALTFEPDVSELITKYANKLYNVLDSDVILGSNSIPHLTIGHFDTDEKNAWEIWEKYSIKVVLTPEINFAGITILPSSSGGAWIEISVLKTKSLLSLQEDLINIINPKIELTNDILDLYRPHITIAHTLQGNTFHEFQFDYSALRLKSVKTKLGIGIGTNFEILK